MLSSNHRLTIIRFTRLRIVGFVGILFSSFLGFSQTSDTLFYLNDALNLAAQSGSIINLKNEIEANGYQPVLWNNSGTEFTEGPLVDTVFYDDNTFLILEKKDRELMDCFTHYAVEYPDQWSIYLSEVKSNLKQGKVELKLSTIIHSSRNWICTYSLSTNGELSLIDCVEKIDSSLYIKAPLTNVVGNWEESYSYTEARAYIMDALDIVFEHPYIEQRIVAYEEKYDSVRILNASTFQLCDSTKMKTVEFDGFSVPFFLCKTSFSRSERSVFINGGSYHLNSEIYNRYLGAMVIGEIKLESNGVLEIGMNEIGGAKWRFRFIHFKGKYPAFISVH